jgi:integrase/recombinase XerD
MSNVSENLIFEIFKEISSNNNHMDKDKLYNSLSKVVVKYDIHKNQDYQEQSNLETYINLYLSTMKLEGLSPETLKGYKIHLGKLNESIHKNIEMINAADIRVHLHDYNHLQNSSMATKINTIKSFFGWLIQEEIIEKDPTKKIKSPKFNKINPKFLNVDELEMVREACKTLRERALCEVLYATGMRLSELAKMNIKDIDLKESSAMVIGKGNKEREVLFSVKTLYHLKRYLDSRSDDCEALFVTERKPHRRLSNRAIQQEVNNISKRSIVTKNISPHTFRHTMASLLLNNGADLSVIQKLLGHSSPNTTQIYSHVTDENKRYQYRKHLAL